MRLTNFTDYSLRVLIYLGFSGPGLVPIADIARAYQINKSHLTKVAHNLSQLGYIEAVRGRRGGLRLAKAPAEINLREVVQQTEDNFVLVECFANDLCKLTGACALARATQEALAAFFVVLGRFTLADLIRPDSAELARRLGLVHKPRGPPTPEGAPGRRPPRDGPATPRRR